jgi:hypothetical protein
MDWMFLFIAASNLEDAGQLLLAKVEDTEILYSPTLKKE